MTEAQRFLEHCAIDLFFKFEQVRFVHVIDRIGIQAKGRIHQWVHDIVLHPAGVVGLVARTRQRFGSEC